MFTKNVLNDYDVFKILFKHIFFCTGIHIPLKIIENYTYTSWFTNVNKYIFLYFQPKGHTRVPSSTDLKVFKEVTQRDSLVQLEKEIVSLLKTTPEDKKDLVKSQFSAFSHLFQRFLEESGPSVDWDRIEKLPADAVSKQYIVHSKRVYIISIT